MRRSSQILLVGAVLYRTEWVLLKSMNKQQIFQLEDSFYTKSNMLKCFFYMHIHFQMAHNFKSFPAARSAVFNLSALRTTTYW